MKRWVYVLFQPKMGFPHKRMVLEVIEAEDVLSADKQLKALGIDVARRPDIITYPLDKPWTNNYLEDCLGNFCSH